VELSDIEAQQAQERLIRKMGPKNYKALIERLGKNKQFLNAINTPTGQEVISLVLEMIQSGIDDILRPGLSKEEWNELYEKYLELHAALKFHGKVVKRFATYDKDKNQINKALGD